MKRLLILLLAFLMLTGIALAEPQPPTFPLTEEKITLKILTGLDARVEDFATNACTLWLEDKTNIHLEWEVVGDMVQAKSMILAGGDYPDIFLSGYINQNDIIKYGTQQGAFLPLNDLIEKYGYYTKQVFEQSPYLLTDTLAPDGNIYSLSQVNEAYHMTLRNKMWINKTWLDNLGLEMPTTTQEVLEVLIAFRDKDPNGNGIKDEIPLSGIGTYSYLGSSAARSYYSPLAFLISAFIPFDTNNGWIQPFEGKADVSFNKPEFKEGLEFVRQLYAEGLIDPEYATQDRTTMRAKVAHEEGNLIGMFAAHSVSAFCDMNGEQHKEYVYLEPVAGPSGLRATANYPYSVDPSLSFANAFIISSTSKYPELAFQLGDFFYSQEFTMRAMQGEAGVEYRLCEPGELGINGEQAYFEPLISISGAQNRTWSEKGNLNRSDKLRLSELAEQDILKPTGLETRLYQATKAYEPFATPVEKVFPQSLFIKEDHISEYTSIKTTIDTYVAEALHQFITSDRSVDEGWDEYVNTLNNMGLERYLTILQEAYDASAYAK